MFAIFIYEMFGVDVNFFDKTGEPRKSNKDLFGAVIMGLLSLVCLYFMRFLIQINSYIFLIILSGVFMFYAISACHIIG